MKAPTQEILEAAAQMRADGVSWKQVLATPFLPNGKVATKKDEGEFLSYSQAWFYAERTLVAGTKLDFAGKVTPEKVASRRAEGYSWGEIAVQANLPESRIRKQFTEATALKSAGLRTGQGGRFLRDEPDFYTADRKVTGVEVPVTKTAGEVLAEIRAGIDQATAKGKARAKRATTPKVAATPKPATSAPKGSRKAKRETGEAIMRALINA